MRQGGERARQGRGGVGVAIANAPGACGRFHGVDLISSATTCPFRPALFHPAACNPAVVGLGRIQRRDSGGAARVGPRGSSDRDSGHLGFRIRGVFVGAVWGRFSGTSHD